MNRSWKAVVSAWLVPVAGLGIAATTSVPTRAQAQPPKVVVIDGQQTPEAIPEHWVWRDGCYFLEMAKRREAKPLLDRLQLSAADLELVLATAVKQPERDAACAARIERNREALAAQGGSPEALARAYQDDTVACRELDLAVRDRLLEAVTPAGRAALETWMQEHRRTLTVTVPADEIEHFKQPR